MTGTRRRTGLSTHSLSRMLSSLAQAVVGAGETSAVPGQLLGLLAGTRDRVGSKFRVRETERIVSNCHIWDLSQSDACQ